MNNVYADPDPLPKTFREFYTFGHRLFPRENWLLFIPHWLVLVAFLLPWSVFLIYRGRKTVYAAS